MSEASNEGIHRPPSHADTILMRSPGDPCQHGAVHKEELTYSDDGVDLTLIRWMLSFDAF